MEKYHKIQTVFVRDPAANFKTVVVGEFSKPEFNYLKNCEWVATEKVDGTSIRIMWDGSTITYGGRTDKSQLPASLFKRLQDLFMGKEKIFTDRFGTAMVCLYGEGYGADIQMAGAHYKATQDFVLFDVRVNEWWLERNNVTDVAGYFGIEVVPIVKIGTLEQITEFVSDGFKSCWGEFLAEGVVMRPKVELLSRKGERIITKLKLMDFGERHMTEFAPFPED